MRHTCPARFIAMSGAPPARDSPAAQAVIIALHNEWSFDFAELIRIILAESRERGDGCRGRPH
jgi:hypothetical protein